MPDNLSVTAYAKINLSLDITGTRPDGYHTLSTVMQSIDLHDTLSVEKFIALFSLFFERDIDGRNDLF